MLDDVPYINLDDDHTKGKFEIGTFGTDASLDYVKVEKSCLICFETINPQNKILFAIG